jgi:hypothetical protein
MKHSGHPGREARDVVGASFQKKAPPQATPQQVHVFCSEVFIEVIHFVSEFLLN